MYLLQGKLAPKTGQADTLAEILLTASEVVAKMKGCRLYVIGKDERDDIHVTEIWDSKEQHDLSLKNEEVRTLIARAIPLLEEMPGKGLELNLLGGHGI